MHEDATPSRCIWCGIATTSAEPVEHIVPESMGCPDDLVLGNGEVCGPCNHALAHLDLALVTDFQLIASQAGVTGKRGKPVTASSYGNLRTLRSGSDLGTYLNMGPGPMTLPTGEVLPPYRGRPRDVNAKIRRRGNIGIVSFKVPFAHSTKVPRALVKVAAEFFCWMQGRNAASRIIAGPVSDFVRDGRGERPVLYSFDGTGYRNQLGVLGNVGEDGWYCSFRLACCTSST